LLASFPAGFVIDWSMVVYIQVVIMVVLWVLMHWLKH